MSRVTDKNSQLARWLNRIFPPSAPRYTLPSEIDEVLRLTVEALPPSLLIERLGFFSGSTINPATELWSPASQAQANSGDYNPGAGPNPGAFVPFGKFLWVLGARWYPTVAFPATAGAGFIGIRPVGAGPGDEVFVAEGFHGSFQDVSSHAITTNAGGNSSGGGTGPFIVPPGYQIHFSSGSAPGATTLYRVNMILAELTIGEQIFGSV